jgi:hypothetical protein
VTALECLLLALLRHHEASPSCLLLGVKRSCRKHRLRSEFDPKATSKHKKTGAADNVVPEDEIAVAVRPLI